MTGASYGFLALVVLTMLDPPSGGVAGIGTAVYLVLMVGAWAAAYGALFAVLPGVIGAVPLWCLAELGVRRRPLLLTGAALGAALGWFWVDAVIAGGLGPGLHGRQDLVLWRGGPAAAGACGAAWQAARTAGRRSRAVG